MFEALVEGGGDDDAIVLLVARIVPLPFLSAGLGRTDGFMSCRQVCSSCRATWRRWQRCLPRVRLRESVASSDGHAIVGGSLDGHRGFGRGGALRPRDGATPEDSIYLVGPLLRQTSLPYSPDSFQLSD